MKKPHFLFKFCTRIALGGILGMGAMAAHSVDAQDLYWTVNGASIRGADADGSNVQTVFDGTGMYGTAVDVVATASHIYWTDKTENGGAIWRANRDGTAAEKLVDQDPMFRSPQFIVLDEANDRLYFSCYYNGLFSAKLSDGTDLTDLGQPSSNHTGVALRTSNELLSVNGASGDGTIYRTDIAARTHAWWKWIGGNGQNYGFVLDTDTDIAYATDYGDGALRSFNINDGIVTELLTDLNQPLGLTLSPSKTHLIFVERGNNTISAYELATGDTSVLTSGDAHFGVAMAADPQTGVQLPQPEPLPVVETFENGTPGQSIQDQLTSDGKASWRVSSQTEGTQLHYGGETGSVTFEPYNASGTANLYLEHDVDETEHFRVKFEDVLLRGGRGDIDGEANLGTRVTIGARKTDDSDFGTYRIGQWATVDGDNYTFRYGIHYLDVEGNTHISPGNWVAQTVPVSQVDAGDYSGSELLLSGLEIRVQGDQQRLYLNGNPQGGWFQTQGAYGDGSGDIALVVHTAASSREEAFINPRFDGLSLDLPPVPPFKRLYAYDGFDYTTGDLVGQAGGLGWSEPWAPSTEGGKTDWPIAQVLSPGLSFGDLVVEGNKAAPIDGGRAFRYIDVPALYTGEEPGGATESIGWPGTSVWISFIVEGAAAQSDPFWGFSLFNGTKEKLFFGKATNGAGLRLSAQGGFQQFNDAISLTDKHFIVIRIDVDPETGDAATLFLNPDPMSRTPSDDEALGVYTGAGFDMAFNRVRFATGGGPGGTVDEVRIGATWSDVTPVPYDGFVNGDLEDEPLARGWSFVRNISEQAGIAPGSATAVYINNHKVGSEYPILSQHRPNWIEMDTLLYADPVTGEPLASSLEPTTPEWQIGFYTAVADAGGATSRSLNVGINFERPDGYTSNLAPAINFRITGTGAGEAYSTAERKFMPVFPEGTFTESTVTNGSFVDPTVYYVQFDGDFTTSSPTYTVSVREAGQEQFAAVSDPVAWYQYESPQAGSGVTTVRFNGFVDAPYVVDDIHMISLGDSVSQGYADWAAGFFNQAELADDSISGPSADPDGDGIRNLLEYALGSHPRQTSVADLPVHGVEQDGADSYLTLTFTRPADVSDVNYVVEASADLLTWSSGPLQVASVDNGDGTLTVTYRDAEPISGSTRRFLRLHATQN